MIQQPSWARVIGQLRRSLTYTSKRFDLFHAWRGRGNGVEGVRDPQLLATCVEALEEAWRVLGGAPHSRPLPSGGDDRPQVYVFSVEDWPPQCPSMDHVFVQRPGQELGRLLPVITLPCRGRQTTFEEELRSLRATVAHEITHLFNDVQRPRRLFVAAKDRTWPLANRWLWLDEAIAVFMEMEIYPNIREWLCFAMNWVDRPERPLDAEGAEYEAGMFMRYLVQRTGDLGFPTRVWTPPTGHAPDSSSGRLFSDDLPLETIERVFRDMGQSFCSAKPNVPDVFASGYCMDAYFLSDPNSPCFMPKVHDRYRNRAVTEIVDVRSGQSVELANQSLDHLACRYYRLRPNAAFEVLKIDVRSKAASKLKAEAAMATQVAHEDFRRAGASVRFQAQPEQLSAAVKAPLPKDIDHLVLVVTNCGTRGRENYPDDHDDDLAFSIHVVCS